MKVYNDKISNDADILYAVDMGPNNDDRRLSDYCHRVAELVSINKDSIGIVICGTGIGMSYVTGIVIYVVHYAAMKKLLRWQKNIIMQILYH